MTAVSVLLYELVEEPARVAILAATTTGHGAAPAAPVGPVGAAALLGIVVATAVTSLAVGSGLRTGGPITVGELLAGGIDPSDTLALEAQDLKVGRDAQLLGFPRRWREGWGDDLRAPSSIAVFVDGQSIPFSRREPESRTPAAFYRGPRAELLALRTDRLPRTVFVARTNPWLLARVHAQRIARSPGWLAAMVLAGLASLPLGAWTGRRLGLSRRCAAAMAVGAVGLWWVLAPASTAVGFVVLVGGGAFIATLGVVGARHRAASIQPATSPSLPLPLAFASDIGATSGKRAQ